MLPFIWKTGRRRNEEESVSPATLSESALTTSEWKGFTLMFRMELLVRVHTLVLCLKAARTLKKNRWRSKISERQRWKKSTVRVCGAGFKAYLRVEEAVEQEDEETLEKFKRRRFYTRALRKMVQRAKRLPATS